MRSAQKDMSRRVDAFRNSTVNVPKNGFQGNSVNAKTLVWFIIDSNDYNIHYNKKSNRQVD